jgi:hypothetical protein
MAVGGETAVHGQPETLDVHRCPLRAIGRSNEPGTGRVARRPSPSLPYFAYSIARVSRMTVTLIWPG